MSSSGHDPTPNPGSGRWPSPFTTGSAGDKAATKLAEQLMAAGIECWRIQFPKGMDANDYAMKVQPAAKSLGMVIRKAVWLGKGTPPEPPSPGITEDAIQNGHLTAKVLPVVNVVKTPHDADHRPVSEPQPAADLWPRSG